MRRIFPALAFAAATLFVGTASAADLTVELHGIRAQTGTIRLAVVDGQASWTPT